MLEIKEIKPSETVDLRHRILSPNQSIDSIILAKDDSGQHFGLFKHIHLISVISLLSKMKQLNFANLLLKLPNKTKDMVQFY